MRGVRFQRVRHGRGSYIDEGLDIYDGQWKRDIKHGKGTRFSSSMEYNGVWVDGLQLGPAEVTYANGDVVKSDYNVNFLHKHSLLNPTEYAEGIPQGETSYTFIDSSTYEGAFRDGRPNGYGVYCCANGDVYAGQWRAGRREGQKTTRTQVAAHQQAPPLGVSQRPLPRAPAAHGEAPPSGVSQRRFPPAPTTH